jgi:hypothetical protein
MGEGPQARDSGQAEVWILVRFQAQRSHHWRGRLRFLAWRDGSEQGPTLRIAQLLRQ